MKECPINPEYYRYHAKGKVRYGRHQSEDGHGWVVIDCPNSISYYYNRVCRWLLNTHKISLPLHGSHITVIAGKYTTIDSTKHDWEYRNNEWVDFWYGTIQNNDEGYYWISVVCPAAEDIRLHYGLTPTPKFQYHLTVGYLND